MTVKITGPAGTTRTDKSKKSGKANATDRAKFTSLLDAIMGSEAADAVEGVPSQGMGGQAGGHSYVPQDPQERSVWVLQKLEKLYADVLSGTPTVAAAELRQALQTAVKDRENLPQHLQNLLKELDLRSAVEIAKLEAGKAPSDV